MDFMSPDEFLKHAKSELEKKLSPARITSIKYVDPLKTVIAVVITEIRRWPNIQPPSVVWDANPEAPIMTGGMAGYREATFHERFECNVRHVSLEEFVVFIHKRKEDAFEYERNKNEA